MKRISKYYILLALLIASTECMLSQAYKEDFDDFKVVAYQDTVVYRTKLGNLWFGPLVGLNSSIYYNELKVMKYPNDPNNPFNVPLHFNNALNSGWFTGFLFEYMPPDKLLAYGGRINYPDIRFCDTKTEVKSSGFTYKYLYSAEYRYLSLTPYCKYNFPIEGLYATMGVNLEIPILFKAYLTHIRPDTTIITHKLNIEHIDKKIRYGLELGVGYEFTEADINNKIRTRFNPYINFSLGSKILGDMNSSWNNFLLKFGFAIKFSFNKLSIDTLKFNKDSYQVPEVYAIATTPTVINYEARNIAKSLPAFELDVVNKSEPVIEVSLEGTKSRINSATVIDPERNLIEEQQQENLQPVEEQTISQNEVKVKLKFGTENSKFLEFKGKTTNLTDEMKRYLDRIVEESENKKFKEVYIFGHTADLGDKKKNLKVSEQLAKNAYNYLINKGIEKKGIIIYHYGRGAFNPKESNADQQKRYKNNRIEIVLK